MVDLSKTFFPGLKYIKDAYGKTEGWYPDQNITFILHRAIVIDVKKDTQTGDMSLIIPPFSINAKIINEDVSSDIPQNDEPQWFPPLTSIHNIDLPENGETVWIIRSSNTREARAFWIGRVNDTDKLNLALSNDFANTFTFSSSSLSSSQISPQHVQQVYSIPARNGDVIAQGRSDSYIRHSFNPKNTEGVLEFGVKERRAYDFSSTGAITIGNTKTKTVHVASSSIANVIGISSVSGSISANSNFIANIASQIYNISISENSETQMYKHVLGEKNTGTLKDIVEMINTLNNNFEKFISIFLNHNHNVPEQKFRNIYTISIPPQGGSKNIDVDIKFPVVGVSPAAVGQNSQNTLNSLRTSLNDVKLKLVAITTKIPDTLSKNQFLN